ncbi:unnamed protein product [Amoebophrya sp. A25]|nr:unnamed protein product [Amoebophrya sp. A25]|eukprot:GSA25T00010479001.1
MLFQTGGSRLQLQPVSFANFGPAGGVEAYAPTAVLRSASAQARGPSLAQQWIGTAGTIGGDPSDGGHVVGGNSVSRSTSVGPRLQQNGTAPLPFFSVVPQLLVGPSHAASSARPNQDEVADPTCGPAGGPLRLRPGAGVRVPSPPSMAASLLPPFGSLTVGGGVSSSRGFLSSSRAGGAVLQQRSPSPPAAQGLSRSGGALNTSRGLNGTLSRTGESTRVMSRSTASGVGSGTSAASGSRRANPHIHRQASGSDSRTWNKLQAKGHRTGSTTASKSTAASSKTSVPSSGEHLRRTPPSSKSSTSTTAGPSRAVPPQYGTAPGMRNTSRGGGPSPRVHHVEGPGRSAHVRLNMSGPAATGVRAHQAQYSSTVQQCGPTTACGSGYSNSVTAQAAAHTRRPGAASPPALRQPASARARQVSPLTFGRPEQMAGGALSARSSQMEITNPQLSQAPMLTLTGGSEHLMRNGSRSRQQPFQPHSRARGLNNMNIIGPGASSSGAAAHAQYEGDLNLQQPTSDVGAGSFPAPAPLQNSSSRNIVIQAPMGLCVPDIHAPVRIRALRGQVARDSADVAQRADKVQELQAVSEDKAQLRDRLVGEIQQAVDETAWFKNELKGTRIDNQQLTNEIVQMEASVKEKERLHAASCETARKNARHAVLSLELKSLEQRVRELPTKIEKENEQFEAENEQLVSNLSTAEEDLQQGHDTREQAIESASSALSAMMQKRSDAEAKKALQLSSLAEVRERFKHEKENLHTVSKEKMGIYKCLQSANRRVSEVESKDEGVAQKIRLAENKIKSMEARLLAAAGAGDARDQDLAALREQIAEQDHDREALESQLRELVKAELVEAERRHSERQRQACSASSPMCAGGAAGPAVTPAALPHSAQVPPSLPKQSFLETQLCHLSMEKLVWGAWEGAHREDEIIERNSGIKVYQPSQSNVNKGRIHRAGTSSCSSFYEDDDASVSTTVSIPSTGNAGANKPNGTGRVAQRSSVNATALVPEGWSFVPAVVQLLANVYDDERCEIQHLAVLSASCKQSKATQAKGSVHDPSEGAEQGHCGTSSKGIVDGKLAGPRGPFSVSSANKTAGTRRR